MVGKAFFPVFSFAAAARVLAVIGFDLTAGYGVCSEEGVKWDLGGKQEKLAWVLVGKHGVGVGGMARHAGAGGAGLGMPWMNW